MDRISPTKVKFPPEALAAFREMVRLEELADTWPPSRASGLFDAWSDQHKLLHRSLSLQPWQYWCVQPPDVSVRGTVSGENCEGAWERYRALCAACGIEFEDSEPC
jgi:hypothetical protein